MNDRARPDGGRVGGCVIHAARKDGYTQYFDPARKAHSRETHTGGCFLGTVKVREPVLAASGRSDGVRRWCAWRQIWCRGGQRCKRGKTVTVGDRLWQLFTNLGIVIVCEYMRDPNPRTVRAVAHEQIDMEEEEKEEVWENLTYKQGFRTPWLGARTDAAAVGSSFLTLPALML